MIKRRRRGKTTTKPLGNPGILLIMEDSECIVCFSKYNDEEQRPRSMPCGHTMCSLCLERAILEQSKMCPKCRTPYSASSVKELPVNFSLEGLVKSLSTSNKLNECTEHQLPVSHRCTTHKAWVCKICLLEDHSEELCKIITIWEDFNIKKGTKLNKSKPLINKFEETCQKINDCIKLFKKVIEENDEEIIRCETLVKRLQEDIQRKKTSKLQMEKNYDMFGQKIKALKVKRRSYDKAVTSLQSSESIREVSRCSIDVQNEVEKLQSISHELENEVDLMLQTFKTTMEPSMEHCLGEHKSSVKDGRHHIHVLQRNTLSKSIPQDLQFSDETNPPLTDGMLTFLDIAWPNQNPRRVYMKMIGNTARARQHLLLVTGHLGHSYKGLQFYNPNNEGRPGESIVIHPYDGDEAAPLLKDVTVNDCVKFDKRKAGLISGAGWDGDRNTALIRIYLRNDSGRAIRAPDSCFGEVTSGLEILQDIAKSNEIDEIEVVDCGVVTLW
ncbi:unnamed protein product [Meganyctiphanes norvegica]|uniref:RING-type domain-containing protein n=1 Tax=Meganyctiphanes norvegica TaxID=48144 RepID=A0AAV2SCA6_MEGNR